MWWVCFGVWTGWNVGTAVCCNSRALPPSDFYFLTSECCNLQFKGFEKIRGKEGMWFEINPQDIPFQSFFFPDFCGECYVTCVAEHACERVIWASTPPFVNRNSCLFPPKVHYGSLSSLQWAPQSLKRSCDPSSVRKTCSSTRPVSSTASRPTNSACRDGQKWLLRLTSSPVPPER